MKILCSAITKNGVFVPRMALVEEKSLAIPFTLYSMESEEVISFDLIESIVLMGDMDKDPPDEVSVADFHGSMRRTQATINQKLWRKIKGELKQRGIHLHDRH